MRRTLAVLLLSVTALTGTATAAFADKPVDIIVEDTAGVLDANTLIPAIKDIDFYEPTTVAVYTRAGEYEDNFNEEVLIYAKAEHPEWLSADGQKWADGLYIFALDPIGRQVGTYMGEDRKVDLGDRTKIQESTFGFLRDAQWTDGAIQGVESGAEIINRPWYKSPAFLGMLTFLGIGTAAGTGTWLAVRARNLRLSRKALKEGDASYSNVTMDLDATELNANTIPAGSTYGAKVLEKYRNFSSRYEKATEFSNQVHAYSDKELKKGGNRKIVQAFAVLAAELDGDDDLIADTNMLLNQDAGWASAWDRQVAPLREDLNGIEEVLSNPGSNSETGRALSSFGHSAKSDLTTWGMELERKDISPEKALDRLRDCRQRLTELLRDHSQTVIGAVAKTNEEARMMRRSMDNSFQSQRRYHRGGIVDTAFPSVVFFAPSSFSHGYRSGQSEVASARRAAEEASRPSTGYGSSGGSFSGSGSSSRF